jgi:hypothetical protein
MDSIPNIAIAVNFNLRIIIDSTANSVSAGIIIGYLDAKVKPIAIPAKNPWLVFFLLRKYRVMIRKNNEIDSAIICSPQKSTRGLSIVREDTESENMLPLFFLRIRYMIIPELMEKAARIYFTTIQFSPVTAHTAEMSHERRGGLKVSGSGVPFSHPLALARKTAPSHAGNWMAETRK